MSWVATSSLDLCRLIRMWESVKFISYQSTISHYLMDLGRAWLFMLWMVVWLVWGFREKAQSGAKNQMNMKWSLRSEDQLDRHFSLSFFCLVVMFKECLQRKQPHFWYWVTSCMWDNKPYDYQIPTTSKRHWQIWSFSHDVYKIIQSVAHYGITLHCGNLQDHHVICRVTLSETLNKCIFSF